MTEPQQQHSDELIRAAQWLAEQNPPPKPMIPALRERFGLSALEASEACALSNKYRIWRKAHG